MSIFRQQRQKGGSSSTNLQATGDINIGLDYGDVKQIVDDRLDAKLDKLINGGRLPPLQTEYDFEPTATCASSNPSEQIVVESPNQELALENVGYTNDALDVYVERISDGTETWEAHVGAGNVLRAQEDFDGAIQAYYLAIKEVPECGGIRNNLALAFKGKGDIDRAVAELYRSITLSPDLFMAHANLASILSKKGYYDAAIAEYRIALHINPQDEPSWQNLAFVLVERKGDYVGGISVLQQLININPRQFLPHYSLGLTLKHNGDFAAAIEEFRIAIELSPQNADAYNDLGISLKNSGDILGAINAYREAIRINPSHSKATSNLGHVLIKSGSSDQSGISEGEIEEAIRLFQIAVFESPMWAPAHAGLACAYALQSNVTKAVSSLSIAIQLDETWKTRVAEKDSRFSDISDELILQELVADDMLLQRRRELVTGLVKEFDWDSKLTQELHADLIKQILFQEKQFKTSSLLNAINIVSFDRYILAQILIEFQKASEQLLAKKKSTADDLLDSNNEK